MKNFQSNSYKNFLDSHTQLNTYIKVTSVAVDYLYNSSEDTSVLSNLINTLILSSGERWTPRIIKDPKTELAALKNDITKSAIIWVYSAFDVYFKQIEGVLSASFKKDVANSREEEPDVNKIIELYHKLNWSTAQIENLLPILNLYEALRHSIAHNMGKPSGKLMEIFNSETFNNAIINWKTKFPKRSISAPPIIEESMIELKPHHSILYSETCLRIARDIDQKFFTSHGAKFFIDKIVKKHLNNVTQLSQPNSVNLERYLAYHLRADFNVYLDKEETILEYIQDENEIKEMKKKYNYLKLKGGVTR